MFAPPKNQLVACTWVAVSCWGGGKLGAWVWPFLCFLFLLPRPCSKNCQLQIAEDCSKNKSLTNMKAREQQRQAIKQSARVLCFKHMNRKSLNKKRNKNPELKMLKFTAKNHFGQKLKQTIYREMNQTFLKREFCLSKTSNIWSKDAKAHAETHKNQMVKSLREWSTENFVLPTKEEDKHYLKRRSYTSSHHDIKL